MRDSVQKTVASLLNYTCILDTNLWPTDSDTLKDHGDSDLKIIADHFGPILNLGVDGTEGLMKQWHELKEFVLVNLKAPPPREIWKKIHASCADGVDEARPFLQEHASSLGRVCTPTGGLCCKRPHTQTDGGRVPNPSKPRVDQYMHEIWAHIDSIHVLQCSHPSGEVK